LAEAERALSRHARLRLRVQRLIFLVDDHNEQVFYDVDGIDFPGLVVDYELGKITHN